MPLLQRETPTLGKRIYELLKELIQEILLYIMKFKAWLTPGTADDQVCVICWGLAGGRGGGTTAAQ
jgi:hypothetical protein